MISVFGGRGFIGSAFRKHCSDVIYSVPRNIPYPASGSDILYLISTTDNYNVWGDIHLDVQTNLVWLLKVLEQVNPQQTFNFISSWFALYPKGFYSATKLCAEHLIRSYCETRKIPYRILRLANVYGPGDAGCSQKKNAMQWLVGKVRRGEDVSLYGGGSTVRDYLHVTDAVRAIDLCIRNAPKNVTLNVGSGKKYRLRKIIEYAKEVTGSCSQIIDIAPSDFHKQVQINEHSWDVSPLTELGFRQKITLKQGVRELCQLNGTRSET